MDKLCCDGLKFAINNEYVLWPITYDANGKMRHLTPMLASDDQMLQLNYCPFCGKSLEEDVTNGR